MNLRAVPWVQVTKAGVAAALAWELAASVTSSTLPVFAPLAAMLCIAGSVADTVRKALQRTAAVVLGVLVAYLLARLLGLHWWSIGIVVFLAYALGAALTLGEQGSSQVPVSALLVLTLGVGTHGYAAARVLDTVLGAVVGVLVNTLIAPPVHLRDAALAVRRLTDSLAVLTDDLARQLGGPWSGREAERLLTRARLLDQQLLTAREAVREGARSVRWNVRAAGARPTTARHRNALRALEHVAMQLRGVTRTLADAAAGASSGDSAPAPSPPARTALADAFTEAAALLRVYGRVAGDDGSPPAATAGSASPAALEVQFIRAQTATRHAVAEIRAHPLATEAWLVAGSILTDLGRLTEELRTLPAAGTAVATAPDTRSVRRRPGHTVPARLSWRRRPSS